MNGTDPTGNAGWSAAAGGGLPRKEPKTIKRITAVTLFGWNIYKADDLVKTQLYGMGATASSVILEASSEIPERGLNILGEPDPKGAKIVKGVASKLGVVGELTEAGVDIARGKDVGNAVAEAGLEIGTDVAVGAAICAAAEPCGLLGGLGALAASFIDYEVEDVPNPQYREPEE